MAENPFMPYWLPLHRPEGPKSWVFFVVAQIAGHHRPIAVVSSVGEVEELESLQGYPLTACCRRIIAIFSDPTNRPAIRAEVSLAGDYYVRAGNREYRPEPVELPEHNRRTFQGRHRPWNRTSICEFPFIATCLLQGVGFDAHTGRTAPALPEPLATVYRDTSTEWGMVIVDITDLDAVRYGIVGFAVSMTKLISSPEIEKKPFYRGATGVGLIEEGPYKVIEDSRARNPMSAAKYMAKFDYEYPPYADTSDLLDRTLLIDEKAMSLAWPPRSDYDARPPPVIPPIDIEKLGRHQAVTRFIERAIGLDQYYFSLSNLDKQLFSWPNFRELLRKNIVQHFNRLSNSKSFGQLIRLAFVDQNHLSLEQLENLSAELISAALDKPEVGELRSLSFCIDRVQSTPAQIADVLSRFDTLCEIYLLQSPTRESDRLSVQLFEELVARPEILSRAKVMLAGVYSSAMRQTFWPSTSPECGPIQSAPLEVFPVQQILVRFEERYETYIGREPRTNYAYHCVCLRDGFLKPEHFAANFLLYLYTLDELMSDYFGPKAQLFSLSSGPGSFNNDPQSAAQVSPILAENFALPLSFPDNSHHGVCSPLARDLVLGGWTAIVLHEESRTASEPSIHVRYALARPLQQPIMVDHPPLGPPAPEDLEVVGLKEFLATIAPSVDPTAVDHRLQELHEKLAKNTFWRPLSSRSLSVLSHSEAAEILLDSLRASRERKEAVRELMGTADEKWDSYSTYWVEKNT